MSQELLTENRGGGDNVAARQETTFDERGRILVKLVNDFNVHGYGMRHGGQPLELGPLPKAPYEFPEHMGSIALVHKITVKGSG